VTTAPAPVTAAIVTVGDELLLGEVQNTNSRWLGRELERLGVTVQLIATLPDDRTSVARFLAWAQRSHDCVLVTGGLGPTPDDVTRDAVADAFGVGRRLHPVLARELEASGGHGAIFAPEWARLPDGSRVLHRSPGGAPAFAVGNVYALAGLPAEMRATFKSIREELRAGTPRPTWRRRYATTEDRIAPLLGELTARYSSVAVGSYPRFGARGPEVELVLRCAEEHEMTKAAARLEEGLSARGIAPSEKARANTRRTEGEDDV
jgi:molybdenum cofactor synthesis domain-containing protein